MSLLVLRLLVLDNRQPVKAICLGWQALSTAIQLAAVVTGKPWA